jgi:hypothetical protein
MLFRTSAKARFLVERTRLNSMGHLPPKEGVVDSAPAERAISAAMKIGFFQMMVPDMVLEYALSNQAPCTPARYSSSLHSWE